jgi:ferredoxin-NADP reductase
VSTVAALFRGYREGFRRRIDRMMLAEVAWPPSERPMIFICGPTPLVEAAAATLVELGHDPTLVKTERFQRAPRRDASVGGGSRRRHEQNGSAPVGVVTGRARIHKKNRRLSSQSWNRSILRVCVRKTDIHIL